MMSRGKWVSGLLASFCLAACSTMPLGSLAKLSAVDMGHTPPDQMRVAFITPDVLKIRPGDMVMKVHLKLADGSFDSARNFALLETNGATPASLTRLLQPREAIHIMKFDDADAEAFQKLQKVLSENKLVGRKKGALEINFGSQACASTPLSGPLLVSAAIKTAELSDYTVLFSRVDISAMAKQAGQNAQVKPCVS